MTSPNENFRVAWFAIAGPPNAGKSTLLNRLIGQKIAIATPKPETTRSEIKGVYTDADGQIVFCDTPGLHRGGKGPLQLSAQRVAREALKDADGVLWIVDASDAHMWRACAEELVAFAEAMPKEVLEAYPAFVVFNKADLVAPAERERLAGRYATLSLPFPCFFVSSLSGEGVQELMAALKLRSKPGSPYYPDDIPTDRDLRFLAAEAIREQCLLLLHQELPYGIAVVIDQFSEGELVRIEASIVVNRESHKGMVIGKGGAVLKKIGEAARREIETLCDSKVFLKLFVRVEDRWVDNPKKIREFLG